MKDVKKIWVYFKPIIIQRKKLLLSAYLLIVIGFTFYTVLIPVSFKNLIDEASTQFSNSVFSYDALATIVWYITLLLVGTALLRRVGSRLLINFENKLFSDVHNKSFADTISQTYLFFSNNFTGSLVNKVNRLGGNLQSLISGVIYDFSLIFAQLVFSIIILWYQNSFLAFAFTIFSVIFIIVSIFFTKKQAALDKNRAEKGSARAGVLSDILMNIFNLKIFSAHTIEKNNYGKSVQAVEHARYKSWIFQDNVRIIKNIYFLLFHVGLLFVSIKLFADEKITLGVLVLAQTYATSMLHNIWNLNRALTVFIETFSDTVDAIEVVTTPMYLQDPEFPQKITINNGKIIFSNVQFTYPEGDHVFEEFNLEIPAGQSVGVVGTSGAGKTTITKLLLRFYDVTVGKITIDGQDITQVTQNDLRNKIAYIPQDSMLFHRSILENIRYGNPEATDDEVIQAAKFAHADEFINDFEDKYQTLVGERGVKLSGGQKQRIAIARAMLKKNAPVLMMDEATSSLDSLSEAYIQESFEKLMRGKTTIVVAHRLSTIKNMDRIIVLENGNIVEDGSHDALILRDGYYKKLWDSQTKESQS